MLYIITPNGEFSTVINKEVMRKVVTMMVINPELYMDAPKEENVNYKLSEVITVCDEKIFKEKHAQHCHTSRPYNQSLSCELINEYAGDLIKAEMLPGDDDDTSMKYSEVMGSLDMLLTPQSLESIESLHLTEDTVAVILDR